MLDRKFIGFMGAGGTGKTTTAKALVALAQQRGHDWGMLPSASRGVFEAHNVKREDDQDKMTPEQRWMLQHDIQLAHFGQQQRMANETKHEKVVCDRTQMDQFAYAMLQCSHVMSPDRYDWIEELCQRTLTYYSHLFYFPFYTYESIDDGMRTSNWGMRKHFDMLLRQIKRNLLPSIGDQSQGTGLIYGASFSDVIIHQVPTHNFALGMRTGSGSIPLMSPEDRAGWILQTITG